MHHPFAFCRLCFSGLLIFIFSPVIYGQPSALPRAHAHNDYRHPRPLIDAWEQGFISIEADIHLIKGELYVSHGKPLFRKKKHTLRNLYLQPLQEIVSRQNGQVYPGYDGPFYLMIDVKTDAERTYEVLHQQLQEYASILTRYPGGEVKNGAVTVFISGNRSFEKVMATPNRFAALDGRPPDLGKEYAPALVPVISDNYKNHLSWNGEGQIPAAELSVLQTLVEKTHSEGKKLRLWATPDRPEVWKALYQAGVDLINTDKLEGLRIFLTQTTAVSGSD